MGFEPSSAYSIEIAFPEIFSSVDDIDCDVFDAGYISKCIEEEGLLDLEKFRYYFILTLKLFDLDSLLFLVLASPRMMELLILQIFLEE